MNPSFCKLPFTFDTEALLRDLDTALAAPWTPHFNTDNYSGDWSAIPLRAPEGAQDSIFVFPGSEAYIDLPLLQNCPAFREVLDTFQCAKSSARLLRLAPGAVIRLHQDHALSFEEGTFRIHVPILTHREVKFEIGGENRYLEAGTCWYGNFSRPHRVENPGPGERIHLVFDCKRNEWAESLFADQGFDLSLGADPYEMSEEEEHRMMQELERMGTPAAMEIMQMIAERNSGPLPS